MSQSSFLRHITIALAALSGLCCFTAAAADNDTAEPKALEFSPAFKFHGTLRGRYEVLTDNGDGRFQVRNARLSLGGDVAPWISYLTQVDISDNSAFKFLDGYVTLKPSKVIDIVVGQSRVSFNNESFLAPHSYIFANRSFVSKDLGSKRRPGIKARIRPLNHGASDLAIEANIANSGAHGASGWSNHYTYAARATLNKSIAGAGHNIIAEVGFQSIHPDIVRINCYDAALQWRFDDLYTKAEITHWRYSHDAHPAATAYLIEADYGRHLKSNAITRVSAQTRFDALSDFSTGVADDSGALVTDKCARKRLTIGATATNINKYCRTDLRLNYEHYFYGDNAAYSAADGSKVTIELVVHF